MLKTKCKMKAKYDTRPGRVRHINVTGLNAANSVSRLVDELMSKPAKPDNSMLMDLDELDAYMLANAKRR